MGVLPVLPDGQQSAVSKGVFCSSVHLGCLVLEALIGSPGFKTLPVCRVVSAEAVPYVLPSHLFMELIAPPVFRHNVYAHCCL